ncbi:glycerol-3-phosphate responsive antiterminator [Acetivibrio ethanolgignens]|uniref:Antiterminator n=1 Tax=Acetivibrio ethanolgignens TaxID=290052 RepID=A0A0V8QH02_9FIRM|nr:glycerol-3-phosphate responsive antiterminator [Acetivibrio ethanolgignens]KSV59857.1 hypothetical protein ASU35_07595 [Acetivibrio ethanolgignens]
MINQRIVPAVTNMKDFEKFLESSLEYCVLMNLHISLMEQMLPMAKKKGKKVLVHLELIHGLSGDEYGCEYACQRLRVDGVISTKGKVVETAKRNKKLAILRLFLIDTKSLEKGLNLCSTVQPDYMEVLPGLASSIIPGLKERVNVPMMSGGLIRSREQIEECLKNGACAVTISDMKLALTAFDFLEEIG